MHRDVGEAISKITTPAKFSIVSTYCGHGQYLPLFYLDVLITSL